MHLCVLGMGGGSTCWPNDIPTWWIRVAVARWENSTLYHCTSHTLSGVSCHLELVHNQCNLCNAFCNICYSWTDLVYINKCSLSNHYLRYHASLSQISCIIISDIMQDPQVPLVFFLFLDYCKISIILNPLLFY